MTTKIHEPGKPLKGHKKPSYKKPKIHKSHRAPGKDWFGSVPLIKDMEHA
ncbi:hypothetical protein [Pseudomonas arsenicoxydans]|nr:hypothetical protein [Pseudomonas arsenicoxydans]